MPEIRTGSDPLRNAPEPETTLRAITPGTCIPYAPRPGLLDAAGTTITYSSNQVERHGMTEFVWPGRRTVQLGGRTWPAARPEECTDSGRPTEWITPEILVCTGCGLDCT